MLPRGRVELHRILPGRRAVGQWNVPTTADAELSTEGITMCLGGSWCDTEALCDFLVRAALRDEPDDLSLPVGEPNVSMQYRHVLAMLSGVSARANSPTGVSCDLHPSV